MLGEIHELVGVIALVAINTKLELPDDDGNKRLAGALLEVNKHYKIPMPSPKHMALLAMGSAVFGVYKPVVLSALNGPAPPAQPSQPPAPTEITTNVPAPPAPSAADWGFPAGNA